MAKDDYDFLVLKILTYLYGCLQRKYHFDTSAFTQQIITKTVSEAYIVDVLRMMNAEGLIEGLNFVKAWGNDYILISDYEDMSITAQGIRYLLNNDKMRQLKENILKDAPGLILDLVKLVL